MLKLDLNIGAKLSLTMLLGLILTIGCSTGSNPEPDPTPVMVSPTLQSPANNTIIEDKTPILDWGNVNKAVEYEIVIDDSSSFSYPIVAESVQSSSYTIHDVESLSEGTYYWKVQCRDIEGNWSEWSTVYKFTIMVESGTDVSGTVFFVGSSDPISGVLVKINQLSDTSDINGYYEIVNVPVGEQTLTAFKSDFEFYSESITVGIGDIEKDIFMTTSILSTSVSGYVTYPNGEPAAQVQVKIGTIEDTTDSNGHYHLPSIPQGNVIIEAINTDCEKDIFTSDIYLFSDDKQYDIELPACYVIDSKTDLIWQKYNKTRHNYNSAHTYCQSLNIGGYDWRIPSVKELQSILEYDQEPPIDLLKFDLEIIDSSDLREYDWYFWTSTNDASGSNHWVIQFASSFLGETTKPYYDSVEMNIRCVAGNPITENDFTDNTDGTITDNKNNLMWQQEKGFYGSFDDGLDYCSDLLLADYTDWRVPTISELTTIIDYSKYEPALANGYFEIFAYDNYDYVSSTPTIHTPGGNDIYIVKFSDGSVLFDHDSAYILHGIRCVREP